jgi:hypothetical protein
MKKQMAEERRFWVRAKRVLSIQYRLVKSRRKSADGSWHLSTTQDMSFGGLSFYTDQEYRKEDVLELHVVMSGILDIFNGLGKVVRVEKKATGSYFLVAVKFVEQKRQAKSYRKASPSRTSHHKLAGKRK